MFTRIPASSPSSSLVGFSPSAEKERGGEHQHYLVFGGSFLRRKRRDQRVQDALESGDQVIVE